MKIQNLLENREHMMLLESFDLEKDSYNINWMRNVHPLLMEVALAPDQVKQILKNIETTAGEMGQNRTLAGKAVDTAGEISEKVKDLWFNKLGGALQKSAVVQGFDEKWENIKTKVAAENPKLAQALGKYKEFADANPKLQKFLLMVAASVAGSLGLAVAGGAAAGIAATGMGVGAGVAIVNIVDRLLKNEKLSTAVGRGATAGIVAGLSAAGVKAITTMFNNMADAFRPGQQYQDIMVGNPPVKVRINAEDSEMLQQLHQEAIKSMKDQGGIDGLKDMLASGDVAADTPEFTTWMKTMDKVALKAMDPSYQEAIVRAAGDATATNAAISQLTANAAKASQTLAPLVGAIAGQKAGSAGEKKESYYLQTRPLSEGQVYLLFKKISQHEQLTEGPIWDKVKGAAGAVAGAAAKGAAAVGKQITNKNTYEKLWASWKLEGSPTDSEELAKFLKGQGVSDEVVNKVYGDMKISTDGQRSAEEPTGSGSGAKGIKGKFDMSKIGFYNPSGPSSSADPTAYPDVPPGAQVEFQGKTWTYVKDPSNFTGWQTDDGDQLEVAKVEARPLGDAWRTANGFNTREGSAAKHKEMKTTIEKQIASLAAGDKKKLLDFLQQQPAAT